MDVINYIIEVIPIYPTFITVACYLLYHLYLAKFKFYKYHAKELFGLGRKVRGKCPPFFPNGWYRIARISEIEVGKTYSYEQCGRSIAAFRGNDGVVYVIDPYCPHMGANLGKGGKVVNDSCIQCPFHGFIFDGKTGQSVYQNMQPKPLTKCEYHAGVKYQTCNSEGEALIKGDTVVPSLKKYHVREVNGEVLVWFHSRDEPPFFEPFTYKGDLIERGEGFQYVNAQISEIPENGADIRHFEYIHVYLTPLFKYLSFRWNMKSMRADDPNLLEYMKHDDKAINEWKQKILKQYLDEKNSQYVNVIGLDCILILFGKEIFIMNATGFQVGPSLVHLFFNFRGVFYAAIFQSVTPMEKFMLRVINRVYAPKWMAYWMATAILRMEMGQVTNDLIVWNNKNYADVLHYNFSQESDVILYKWRNWYSQFYDGCHEREKMAEGLNW